MRSLRTLPIIDRRPGRWLATLGLALGGPTLLGGAAGPSGAATSHATTRVVLSTMKSAKLGTILVSGRTLYTLKPVGVGCNAACLKYWPALVLPAGVTAGTAGPGVSAARLGTTRGPRGQRQVAYAGKALYWFSKDHAPGQAKGIVSDTWGTWSVVVTRK